jgi:hypothetical protein
MQLPALSAYQKVLRWQYSLAGAKIANYQREKAKKSYKSLINSKYYTSGLCRVTACKAAYADSIKIIGRILVEENQCIDG